MKSFNIVIVICALCVLCAALPVRDISLIRQSNSSVGQTLLSSANTILKRSPRSIIGQPGIACPTNQFSVGNQCMTCLEFKHIFEDDDCPLDNEIN